MDAFSNFEKGNMIDYCVSGSSVYFAMPSTVATRPFNVLKFSNSFYNAALGILSNLRSMHC